MIWGYLKKTDCCIGKTQKFSDAIEVKQAEKAPWTAKVAEKQSRLDIVESEVNLLEEESSKHGELVQVAEEELNIVKAQQTQGSSRVEDCRSRLEALHQTATVTKKELDVRVIRQQHTLLIPCPSECCKERVTFSPDSIAHEAKLKMHAPHQQPIAGKMLFCPA